MNIKNSIAPLGSFFTLKKLVSWTKKSTIYPFYHTISDDKLPYISNLYPLRSIKEFKQDLDFLCKHFTPIDIEEVSRRVEYPHKGNKPAFHLTFDDGLNEIHSIIAPILEEKGIPATFFVNSDFIDNNKLFYRYKIGLIIELIRGCKTDEKVNLVKEVLDEQSRWNGGVRNSLLNLNYNDQETIDKIAKCLSLDFDHWLSENKPYATSSQIEDLMRRGFTIGSHSIDHPRFKNIEIEAQKIQVDGSFRHLKDAFNIDDRIFSFPFGDDGVNAELFDWMYGEGKCRLTFGVSGLKDDYCSKHIHRIPMDECTTDPQEFIKSEYLYFMLKSVFNKNQIKRK